MTTIESEWVVVDCVTTNVSHRSRLMYVVYHTTANLPTMVKLHTASLHSKVRSIRSNRNGTLYCGF